MIKVEKLNPFGRMCISLGMLPSSYKESLTYEEQLLWFCNYLTETVIPTVNNNAEAVEELQALYTQLKAYVDSYFDDLNVQEEINNKLDEMAEDGTLDEIINQEIFSELNEDIDALNTFKSTMEETTIPAINSAIASNDSSINTLEDKLIPHKDESDRKLKVKLPSPFNTSFFNKFSLLYNGREFSYNLDESDYTENTEDILYIAPNGNNSNAGTYDAPKKGINECISAFNSAGKTNGTIILKDGVYFRGDVNGNITRGCTIKAEHKDKVFVCGASANVTFSAAAGYTNVYVASRSNTLSVIDLQTPTPIELIKKTSLSEVESTEGSYMIDGSNVYVHMINNTTPTVQNCILPLNGNWDLMWNNIEMNYDMKIKIKDINFIGDTKHAINMNASSNSNNIEFFIDNCKSYFGKTSGSFYNNGVKSIIKNSKALFGVGDGIDYVGAGLGIEINCVGAYNGKSDADTYNGSTAHANSHVIRYGGVYNNNHGPNVADVQSGTASLNINCVAYDTNAVTAGQPKSDFSCSQGGCTMFLLNCYAKNSTSRWQLYNDDRQENNMMYSFGTIADSSKINGVITDYSLTLQGYYLNE